MSAMTNALDAIDRVEDLTVALRLATAEALERAADADARRAEIEDSVIAMSTQVLASVNAMILTLDAI